MFVTCGNLWIVYTQTSLNLEIAHFQSVQNIYKLLNMVCGGGGGGGGGGRLSIGRRGREVKGARN